MKRLVVSLLVLALVGAGCSLGRPVPATHVTDISATLNADVSSNQPGEVLYWFEYGKTNEYGTKTADRTLQFPEGHNADKPPVPVSEPLTGLQPETTYHYRVCTSPGAQPGSRGCLAEDRTFTTSPAGVGRSGVAFSAFEAFGRRDIYLADNDGQNVTNLTRNATGDDPTWSPDASKLAHGADGDIWVMDADGTDALNITNSTTFEGDPAWSPRGDKIAYTTVRSDNGQPDISVMNVDGSAQTNLTNTMSNPEIEAAWSPDGRKIAYASHASGRFQIHVMNADGTSPAPVPKQGVAENTAPVWSPDGRRIVYVSNNGLVTIEPDGDNRGDLLSGGSSYFDPFWTADGRLAFSTQNSTYQIHVVDPGGSGYSDFISAPTFEEFAGAASPRP